MFCSVRLAFLTLSLLLPFAVNAQVLEVQQKDLTDWRPVFGSVESVKRALARSRLAGDIHDLGVTEGTMVEKGEVLARVVDEKLKLEIAATDAGIRALDAQIAQAKVDLERIEELRQRGAAPKTTVDQAQTALIVAEENHAAGVARREALLARQTEGDVLAPDAGRVLSVPIVAGMYVNPGETIATIATENFTLRTNLPERHARFLKVGDSVRVLARGELSDTGIASEGRIAKIYPELVAGQVVADIEADGLGDFFVGERVRLLVATGKRPAIVVPTEFLQLRHGVTFARLENASEVVIQPGVRVDGGVEILAGLKSGDRLVSYGESSQ